MRLMAQWKGRLRSPSWLRQRVSRSRKEISGGVGTFLFATLLEERQDLFDQCITGQTMLLSQDRNGAVLDKLVRPADSYNRGVDHLRMQMFHHRATEPI